MATIVDCTTTKDENGIYTCVSTMSDGTVRVERYTERALLDMMGVA